MTKISVRDSYNITGRGLVFTGTLKDNEHLDWEELENFFTEKRPVEINGKSYIIMGIESFGIRIRPEFGLQVREV